MAKPTFKVVFLPAALTDLEKITRHIVHKLGAPQAALTLSNAIDKAADLLAASPYSCELYRSKQPLDAEIRFRPVNNYLLFHTVNKQTVEILHVRYGRQNPESFLSDN
jgi:plasmid stabilization system protein ParE